MLDALRRAYAHSVIARVGARVARWGRRLLEESLAWSWLTSLPSPPADLWGGSALGRMLAAGRDWTAAAWARRDPAGRLPALAARWATWGLGAIAFLVALVPFRRQIGPVPLTIEVVLVPLVASLWLLHWALRSPVEAPRPRTGAAGVRASQSAAGRDLAAQGGAPGLTPSRTGLPATTFDLPFALYLAILALSLVNARSLVEGFQTLARQASFFLLFYMTVDLLRNRRREAAWVIDATLAGGLVVALIGLVQYALGIDLTVSGLAGAGAGSIRGRIGSTQENPNFLSEYLILLIPVALARLLAAWRHDLEGPAGSAGQPAHPAPAERGGVRRRRSASLRPAFYGAAVSAMLVAEFLTYTRGGWLGLAVGVAVFVLLVDTRYLLAVAAVAVGAVGLVPGMLERLMGLFDFAEGTGAFRLNLYRAAIVMWSRSPWLGVGAGNYLAYYPDVIRDYPLLDQRFATYSSHNAFLTVAAETGVLGLAVFLVIVLLALRVAFAGWRNGIEAADRLLFLGGGCGMIAFLVQSLSNITFFHPRVALYYWLLLAVLVALLPTATGTRSTPRPARPATAARTTRAEGTGSATDEPYQARRDPARAG